MSTLICTNRPLHEVALDVWGQMDEEDRLRFLCKLYPASAAVWISDGKLPNRITVRISADMYFTGDAM